LSLQSPTYDLADVYRIAQSGNVNFDRMAFKDSRNHLFFEEEVIGCLCLLRPEHFYKCLEYELPNRNILHFDVYKAVCPNSKNSRIKMYIKFRISLNNWISIGSFKPK